MPCVSKATFLLSATLTVVLKVEVFAYVFRAINTFEDPGYWSKPPYIIQAVLSLVAPSLLAASIYMILGRVILLTDGEHLSLIRKRWLTKFFVIGDVFAFLIQCLGETALTSKGDISC